MRNDLSRQQGGTILGLIIGLIIGLGIALGVAMAITKTPMPFTNKIVRPEKAAPVVSPTSDPNKPLYGNKDASKEAARILQAKAAESQERSAAAAEKAEIKAVMEQSAPVISDKPKKPEAAASEAKAPERKDPPKEVVAKSESAEEKWVYYLQTGAFRESLDAENARAKLAFMGVEAKVTEKQSENGVLYRVRVGPFAQMDTMSRVRGKLADGGVDAAVVRLSR